MPADVAHAVGMEPHRLCSLHLPHQPCAAGSLRQLVRVEKSLSVDKCLRLIGLMIAADARIPRQRADDS